jgi:hypothetical protein
MSRCRQTDAIVGSVLEGVELTRSEATHVSGCSECVRATSQARRFTSELGRVGRDLAPEAMPPVQPGDMEAAIPQWMASRRPWLIAGSAVVAAAALFAIVPVGNSVLGTWTSVPTSSERVALADATVDACRDQATTRIRVFAEADVPDDPALEAMPRLPLVAHDQRGEAAAALFADVDDHAAWICAVVPVDGQPPYVELTGGGGLVPDDYGVVEVWTASAGWNSDYGGRWEIAGRVEGDVEQVTVEREDGREVVATVDHGWFLAWWPSEAEPVSAELRDGDGTVVDTVSFRDEYAHEPSCKVMFLDRLCLWR